MPKKTTDIDESAEKLEVTEAAETDGTEEKTEGYDAAYWEERVDWLVPIDMSDPDNTTFFVQVNGRFFKMKRGTKVNVPRYVVEQYNQQQAQLLSKIQTDQKFAKQTTDMG